MRRAFTTYAAILQIVAVLLLQYYPVASHVAEQAPEVACGSPVDLCGCPPEEIAAHTCCCFNVHKHETPESDSCDMEMDEPSPEQRVTEKREDRAPHYLAALPCGSMPKFLTASLGDLKLLPPQITLPSPVVYLVLHTTLTREAAPSRFAEPPDPPPRLLFLS